MKKIAISVLFLLVWWFFPLASPEVKAQDQGKTFQRALMIGTEAISREDMNQWKHIKNLSVDSIQLKFEITPMSIHMEEMAALGDKMDLMVMDIRQSHHIALNLIDEKTGVKFTEAKVKLKVKAPTKKTQTREMYWMPKMKYFGEDFDLSQAGQYQFTCQFEIQGKKRKAELFFKIK